MNMKVVQFLNPDVLEVSIARKPYGGDLYAVQIMRSEQGDDDVVSLPMVVAARSVDEKRNFWSYAMVASTPETAERAGGILGGDNNGIGGYFAKPSDCEHACRSYMANLALKKAIGPGAAVEHQQTEDADGQPLMVPTDCVWDETGDIARAFKFGTVVPGSWILGFHVNSDEVWRGVKSGELAGVSPRFRFQRSEPVEVERSDPNLDWDPPEDTQGLLTKLLETFRSMIKKSDNAPESEDDMEKKDVEAHVTEQITRAVAPIDEALAKITENLGALTASIAALKPAEGAADDVETQRSEDKKPEPTEMETLRALVDTQAAEIAKHGAQIELVSRGAGKPSGDAEAKTEEKEPELSIGEISVMGVTTRSPGRHARKEGE